MTTERQTDEDVMTPTLIKSGVSLSPKKNEMTPSAATWVEREMVTLSEVRKGKTNIVGCPSDVESTIRPK